MAATPSAADVRPSQVAPRGKDPTRSVYLKLLFFSVAILVAPLTAYYASVQHLFDGNSTYAGGLAAVVVNVVLVAYVAAAFQEDQEELVVLRRRDYERDVGRGRGGAEKERGATRDDDGHDRSNGGEGSGVGGVGETRKDR